MNHSNFTNVEDTGSNVQVYFLSLYFVENCMSSFRTLVCFFIPECRLKNYAARKKSQEEEKEKGKVLF